MADQVVPVTGLDTIGLIEDVPPVSLPPAAFSDCRNVRFRDGAVHKMGGDIDILPYVQYENDTDTLQYIIWWQNPNLSAFNLGYYMLVVTQGDADHVYIVKVDEAGTFEEPLILAPGTETARPANWKGTFTSGGNYQHTFFQGGFAIVLNNGLQTPQYVLDSEDNTVTATVPAFAVLPGWDSYATTTTATRTQAFTGDGSTAAFTLTQGGAGASDTYSNIVVTVAGAAQTLTTDYTISNNVITFTTGNIPENDQAIVVRFTIVLVASRVTAGVVRTYGDFLVAGNLVERDSEGVIVRALPNIIRSSDIAEPGAIPQNWNPFATGVNTADEFVVTGDGIVVDFVELQGNMYVYSSSSISVISRTGNPVTPLSVRPVTSAYGALTTDSVIEFDGRHFVVGSQDIYIFAGHPGSISSLADNKVRHAFYDRLNTLNTDRVFALRYPQEDEIWVCYSTRTSPGDRANEALIWNYRNQTWTKRDLQGVVSGVIGPVPGGGIPKDELGFVETNPTANTGVLGNTHINQIASTGTIAMTGDGVQHQFSVQVPNGLAAHRSTGNPTFRITLGEDFWTGSNPPLRFVAQARVGDEILLNVNIDLPASIGRDTGSTLAYDSSAYKQQVTDAITDHLLLQTAIGTAATSSIRLYEPADLVDPGENTNSSFILEFQNIYSGSSRILNFEPTVEIYKTRPLLEEADLASDDRPVLGDNSPDNSIDRAGRALQDQNSSDGQVFSFDFEDIQDDLANYVFFYKGVANTVAPGDAATYGDLPSTFTIESGTVGGATGLTLNEANPPSSNSDGDDRLETNFTTFETGPLLGSRILEILNGDHELDLRVDSNVRSANRTQSFTAGSSQTAYTLNANGTGSTDQVTIVSVTVDGSAVAATGYTVANNVVTLSTAPDSGDAVVIVFQVNTQVSALNLIAYVIPGVSDGTNDYTLTGDSAGAGIDAASLNFTISQARFDKTTNAWVSDGTEIPGVSALLHYNGDEVASTFGASQRTAYRNTIVSVLENTGLFTTSVSTSGTSAGTVTATSIANRAYLVSMTISGGRLLRTQTFSGTGSQTAFTLNASGTNSSDTISNAVIRVGGSIVTNYTIAANVITFATAPASGTNNITVAFDTGVTPALASFPFNAALVQGRQAFTNAFTLGTNQVLVTPPCIRVVHNDPDIPFFDFDTGVIQLVRERGNNTALQREDWMGLINTAIQTAAPNQWDYSFTSTNGGRWTSKAVRYNRATDGNTVPYPNADGTYDFPANRAHNVFNITSLSQGVGNTITATSTVSTQGVYPNQTLGSHMAVRLNNNSVYLFYLGGHTNATVGAYLKTEIERRIPELQVTVGTNGITIQPSVIGENSVFVEERVVNTEANITRFRELLNANAFTQDSENPEVIRQLPEDVTTATGIGPFPSAAGPHLTGTPDTTYDYVRTWSDEQVNFSVEFPIFAAGKDNRDGSTSNAVLAGDLGYTIPNFSGGTSSYISYIERVQMGMTPEFTTESVKSLALWTDGGSVVDLSGNLRYNALQLDLAVTNNPGQSIDLDNNAQYTNMHYISEDYKMDTRLAGRFLNWRLSDETLSSPTVVNGKTFQRDTDWRVSGMQWKISPAGRR